MNKRKQEALNMAFTRAAFYGHTDVLKMLLKAGADLHVWDDAPLMRAAYNGQTEAVEFLLSAGADPHGDEALLSAAERGHAETIKVLASWSSRHACRDSAPPNPPRP